ncbi:Oxygen evolving enhancer protein 3 (PsbQ) [Musa troglodytarum]|uniref:Oxygen evolving enhancer protein 3 (PsbQ) n=1 Tax=Musa troglodytarum TaxID=320322 RepID=A0A9E7H5C0_9LILI|nr:Oxygen evolving enhancer protein 3 (PsbQ) [Musa troglodytarum]
MRWKGRVHRIRKCAVDLLSMEDDLIDAEEEDGWELTGSELRLKSTFLQLDEALKSRSISWTNVRYGDATHVLQELMAVLMPLP